MVSIWVGSAAGTVDSSVVLVILVQLIYWILSRCKFALRVELRVTAVATKVPLKNRRNFE